MALLTLTEARAFAGITDNNPTRDASLQMMIDEAIDAVKRYCNNGDIERTEYTAILPLPLHPTLICPFAPVTYDPDADTPIDFQLYVNPGAFGDPSAFTSDFLLEPYTDYALDMGPTNVTVSESGLVRFINGQLFVNRERPTYSLSTKLIPTYGAVKLVYTAGYATVPPAVKGALNIIVRKLFNMRKDGAPAVSESLNGYAITRQSSATANGVLFGDPTVRDMLKTFCRPQIGGYN